MNVSKIRSKGKREKDEKMELGVDVGNVWRNVKSLITSHS